MFKGIIKKYVFVKNKKFQNTFNLISQLRYFFVKIIYKNIYKK